MKEADAIVKTGTPWFAKYGYTLADLGDMRASEGWHARYAGGTAGAGAAKTEAGGVY